MFYSEEIIESVRSANDIVDVIGLYVPLKKQGSTFFGPCPFHSEKTPSFSVTNNSERRMFYCYGCHAAGDVITFIMKYENLSYTEAIQFLAQRANITLPKPDYSKARAEKERKRQEILEINRQAALYFFRQLKEPDGQAGYEYLRNRGLSNSTITSFGLGYADRYWDSLYKYIRQKGYSDETLKESGLFVIKEEGGHDYFRNRVMFPIMDARNRVIGFGGRVMGEGEPKYLNSPETACFNKSQTLYGINAARKSRTREFILVEGYMDVISLHQSGFTNAVAGLGTALTDGNVNTLRRYADSVILSYDSDQAGVNAALRAIPKLRKAGLSVRVVNLRPYKDPDELIRAQGKDSYKERTDAAMNALIYEIYDLKGRADISNPDDRSRFYNEIAKKIAAFDDEIERDSYIHAVSREFFIDYDILKNAVRKYALARSGEGFVLTPKKAENISETKQAALDECSRIILCRIASDEEFFKKVCAVLKPEYFTEGFYRDTANILFAQMAAGRKNPDEVIDAFPEIEDREKAAEIFCPGSENSDDKETRQMLNDCIIRLKRSYLEKKLDETNDFGELILIKKEMEGLKGLDIFK